MIYSFIRYLEAKRTVDDRALNPHVRVALMDSLPQRPLEILEVGAGIGTMITRLATMRSSPGGLPDRRHHYVAIDSDPANVRAATQRLAQENPPFNLELITADVFAYLDSAESHRLDLLIAHAFLDLFDLPTILPVLFSPARAGLFYFTLNFDGQTEFEPTFDAALDDHIMTLYHRTMDARLVGGRPSGDSRSGRHLFQEIPAAGGEIIAAGGSDWVVYPRHGAYPDDEAYFLHHILHFVETSLTGNPELEAAAFKRWLAMRHAQIEQGELVYIAHQLDIAGRIL